MNWRNKRVVSGVACDLNTAKAVIMGVPDRPGVAQKVFAALAEANINIDMIIQSMMRDGRNDIAFTVERSALPEAIEIMERVPGNWEQRGLPTMRGWPRFPSSGPGW